MCSASREICCAVNFSRLGGESASRGFQGRGSALDVPQEQKEEYKKMSLLLTDPQSQVFGDEEERDRCMQPLPSQITLK